jgi:hypothetical protein
MFKKILRWLLVLLGIAALLLGLAAWWLSAYLDSNQEKILSKFVATSGLNVTFRELDIKAWKTFPVVNFTVDSLVVRDTTRSGNEPPLLAARHFNGSLTLGNLLFDTLRLNTFELADGAIYVASDAEGNFNLGKFGNKKSLGDTVANTAWIDPEVMWSGMTTSLRNIDLAFIRPDRKKRMILHLDSLRTHTEKRPEGLHTDTELSAFVEGIAFNTDKGAFLTRSPLTGNLHIDNNDGIWELASTTLRIRDERFTFGGALTTSTEKGLELRIVNSQAHYDSTLVLLPEDLQNKLGEFHVSDRFPVVARLHSSLVRGEEPEIEIGFSLAGNDVRINEFEFKEAYTSGAFVNHLPEAEGGIPGSKKNFKVVLDTTRALQNTLRLSMPRAVVRGVKGNTFLQAPVRITGPAREINERVGTENFIFGKGRFSLTTRVNESLNSMPDIIQSSDGQLRLYNANVRYKPAGVDFPLRRLQLRKKGKDIRFDLQSGELSTGFTFDMEGKIDNLLPLLLERPADSMRTDVSLHASRIRWKDFLAMFGENGMFTEEANQVARPQDAMDGNRQVAAMKQTLLGLQASFRPHIEARFDTVAYYDVLSVHNFATGLRFEKDSLVLERTTFDWEGSTLDFGAKLSMGEAKSTPFRLNVATEHLNLNRMRPSLEYFGLKLPAGLDSLPHDLTIDFAHRGTINDSFGIKPGANTGSFVFREGREGLFSGQLSYTPGPEGLRSQLNLEGNPLFVNQLFAAEDFFFGSGRFRINLNLEATPADLNELIESADLSLNIDSSIVEYRPAKVFVPVRKFSVRSNAGQVDYDLALFSDSTRKAVALTGTLDRLSAFLYPEPGKSFRMKAAASAQSFRWSDINGFMNTGEPEQSDTTTFNPQYLLSATGGIFSSFSPELSLEIDTFWADRNTMLTEVRSAFRLADSTRLILETSGFRLGEGEVRFSAGYTIDQQLRSPFNVNWETEALELEKVVEVLKAMGISLPKEKGTMAGTLSMAGDMLSKLDEGQQKVVLDSTTGLLNLELTDLELANWPVLRDLGRKIKMQKRFETLRFAPIKMEAKLENGKVWLPRTEIQSTALQLFLEGDFDTIKGPDFLVAIPLRNIGRGVLESSPAKTGYAKAGWKVYLVMEQGKSGEPKMKFRLGRRKYFRERGRLEELRKMRKEERMLRRAARRE